MKREKYYKGRYMIAFYTMEDDLVGLFNNMKDLAIFMRINPESKEFGTLKSRVSNAVKKKCTLNTRYMIIDHRLARPYLIDMKKDRDSEVLL